MVNLSQKRIFYLWALLAVIISGCDPNTPEPNTPPEVNEPNEAYPEHLRSHFEECVPLDKLLWAIKQVESGGDPNAVGDEGAAVGAYQIHKIYVDDLNRIYGEGLFTYEDRWNEIKSWTMVRRYLLHYATEERLGRKPTLEDMARIHNGGPNGYKKECTKKYWIKVKGEMSND